MYYTSASKTGILKVMNGAAEQADDMLAVEEPLELQLEHADGISYTVRSISVTMRTPGQDEELAAGFLFTEGILRSATQIQGIRIEEENKVLVTLAKGFVPNLQQAERNFYTTSSCGVCGKSSMEAIRTVSVFGMPRAFAMYADQLSRLPALLGVQQEIFARTGGLHASALFDTEGNFIMLREDVGRHNALDKVIGAALLEGRLPLEHVVLLLSGRASFELVQKAVMAGISFVASVGAPSSLAVDMAREHNMTLIGFLRDNRFNIYSGSDNVLFREPSENNRT